MVVPSLDSAAQTLRHAGFSDSTLLGSGMEGHVFLIDDGTVAKVWHSRSHAFVSELKHTYDTLRSLQLSFATPEIIDVLEVGRTIVSIDRFMTGTPLNQFVSPNDELVPSFAIDAVMTVLSELGTRPIEASVTAGTRSPVFEQTPSGVTSQFLANAARNVARFGGQLRTSIPDFDRLYEHIVRHVRRLDFPSIHAFHSDIVTPNILVDDQNRVIGLLDWGHLGSFVGDPVMDASIACGVYNMYGLHHRSMDDVFLQVCDSRLGYNRDRLLLYRALYAVLTSNLYSEDGNDGHYGWCVEMLNREDIRETLQRRTIE